MKLFYIISTLTLLFLFQVNFAFAKENYDDNLTFSLSQDPVFGFYPSVYGSLEINKTTSFTFYGILWTSPLTGNPKYIGADLMTEVGVGVSFALLDNSLTINPSIGVGNGLYQSNANRPLFADNIVPSMAIAYKTGDLLMNVNAVYWKSYRNHGPNTIDMFEYNFISEYPIFRSFSMGLFLDHLITTEKTDSTSRNYTTYFWIGPSFKFQIRNASLWFSTGMDLKDYFADNIVADDRILREFYKLSFSFGF